MNISFHNYKIELLIKEPPNEYLRHFSTENEMNMSGKCNRIEPKSFEPQLKYAPE